MMHISSIIHLLLRKKKSKSHRTWSPQRRHLRNEIFLLEREKGDYNSATQPWILEMERKALWSIRIKVFTLLKRKPSLEGCWLTFPEFPWQLSLFFSKSPPSPMVFSQDCILFALCSSLTINHVEVKRWGWTVAWVLLHMHSDPPQCILPKERQERSGERRCCKHDKKYMLI